MPTTFDAHKNFAYSTVATAPSPQLSGVSLTLVTGGGALMPTAPFNAVIWPSGAQPLAANAEIVRVTAISGNVLTITRTQSGTAAQAIDVGWQVSAAITTKVVTDIENAVNAFTNGGGITQSGYAGAFALGTGDAQSLQLKTNGTTQLTIDTSGNMAANGVATPDRALTLYGPNSKSQLNIRPTQGTNSGFYVLAYLDNLALFSAGAEFTGGAWTARAVSETSFSMTQGNLAIYGTTGLTAGSTFTPVQTMIVTPTGLSIGTNNAPTHKLQLDNDDAAKTATSTWTITSDQRLKKNIAGYTSGLDLISKLNPRTFQYNGLGGTVDGLAGVGLIAQEVLPILPSIVSTHKAKMHHDDPDGSEVDVYTMNVHELLFTMLNAVKEIGVRLTALEAEVHGRATR